MDIISYLIQLIQYQHQQICWLINFICKYIPLKQWAHDDSNSPKYHKFKIDKLPIIRTFHKQDWQFLLEYYKWKYSKSLKPVQRRDGKSIPTDTICPVCGAPHHYIYDNNGSNGQYQCTLFVLTVAIPYHLRKIASTLFSINAPIQSVPIIYTILKKVDKKDLTVKHEKYKYKLHYIYREFQIDFFRMDLNSLPRNASGLKFNKFDQNIMGLCLSYKVNLGLSLRKTAQALKDIHGIQISHQQVANYCKTAAICIKPFVDHYNYDVGTVFTADETYIKIRGIKGYIWFIMDAASRSIIGYQISDNRGVGPCILSMRMAFHHLKELPKHFQFVADGYSAYPLAAQQFFREFGETFKFDITRVIGLTNDDAVSTAYRPYKQMIERLNRTYKSSYRPTNGFDTIDGANYDLALWVAYYNFLRPHKHNNFKVLNQLEHLRQADNMPGKWQLLILLGQQQILQMQSANCS